MKNGERLFKSLRNELKEWLNDAKKVVVLGIGNTYRRDDGIDSIVAQKLRKHSLPRNVRVFDCETVPENFIHIIRSLSPTHIILIDSALINQKPGTVKLISPDKIEGLAISTHTLPLTLLIEYLKNSLKAKVILLAIQPKNINFGFGLTPQLKNTLTNLTKTIVEILLEKFKF
jgi:hydrogenase 3 maturation protease